MGCPFLWWPEQEGPWPAMGGVDRMWALPRAALILFYFWLHQASRGHSPLTTTVK